MASNVSSSGSSGTPIQEYVVRLPKNSKKRYQVMKFPVSQNVDITKWTNSQVRLERENNLKDFKAEEDMPKFGAGSEYGREQREEARRKKYGISMRKYNPEAQPWQLRIGGKSGKRYRGVREGGVSENATYYIFTQATDGAFEAFPVEEWYNFIPVIKYKTLNAEEAEEEFGRREKVVNLFSIMVSKRMKNEEAEEPKEETEEKAKKKKSKKYGVGNNEFKISDMDEWVNSSEEGSDDEGIIEENEKPKNKGKKKPTKKKKKKGESDDEAFEDSDDGDGEGREVDYMSDEVSSSDEERPDEKQKDEMKGVEDEEAIRKMENSESEEENEEPKQALEESAKEEPTAKAVKEKKENETLNKKTAVAAAAASSSDSGSDTSDSDDLDNDTIKSVMFMQKSKRNRELAGNSSGSSRYNAPTAAGGKDGREKGKMQGAGHKRKHSANSTSTAPLPKKVKHHVAAQRPQIAPSPLRSLYSSDVGSEGITEDAVRRYLMRKPMTTTELLHKFKSKKTGMTKEEMVNTIAQILKRLDPYKQMIKGKMYLSIKQV